MITLLLPAPEAWATNEHCSAIAIRLQAKLKFCRALMYSDSQVISKTGSNTVKAIAILLLTVLQFTLGGVAQAQFNLGTNPELPTADQPTEFIATFSGCPSQPVNNIDGMPYDLRVSGFEIDLFFAVASDARYAACHRLGLPLRSILARCHKVNIHFAQPAYSTSNHFPKT